jgi:hypothetical protein
MLKLAENTWLKRLARGCTPISEKGVGGSGGGRGKETKAQKQCE